MANGQGYGRGGVQTGGKGGTGLASAYEFGAKAAGEYLTGGLAGEYAQASETLRKDLPTEGKEAKPKKLAEQITGKKQAKEKLGKLRDIAHAQSVGEFLDFSSSMGRGSQARASQGLLTGNSYAPETTTGFETAAQATKKKPVKKYSQALGTSNLDEGFSALANTSYDPTKPLNFAGAAMGPQGALHRQFQAEKNVALGSEGLVGGISQLAPFDRYRTPQHAQTALQSVLGMSPAERYLRGPTD